MKLRVRVSGGAALTRFRTLTGFDARSSVAWEGPKMSDANPYATPTTATAHRGSSGMRLRRIRFVSGVLIPVSILSGLFGPVLCMIRAFGRLAETEDVSPSQLAGDISNSLIIGAAAIPVAGLAFLVWIWATVQVRRTRDSEPLCSLSHGSGSPPAHDGREEQ
jgi:hypothetical protein